MKFENECKGCRSYNDIKSKGACLACNIPILPDKIKCPCITCLVKTMCARACKEYKDYAGLVHDRYGTERCKEIQERRRYEIKRSM